MKRWTPDQLSAYTLGGEWRTDVSAAEIVSWRAGGQLAYTYAPVDAADIAALLSVLPETVSVVFIGNATNLLVADSGFDGVGVLLTEAVKNVNRGVSSEPLITLENDGALSIFSGVSCAKAAQAALSRHLTGLEFLAGIPGTIGGALTMNAGCHGSSIWQFISRVETVDRQGVRRIRSAEDFIIGYREIKPRYQQKEWFLRAFFALPVGIAALIQEKMQALLAWRKACQPLQWPNAGSVFRNPEGEKAGRLIEQCGLKGTRIGGAEVSMQHGNFILNKGQATATDILALIEKVKSVVQEKTGITLQLEVHVLQSGDVSEHE